MEAPTEVPAPEQTVPEPTEGTATSDPEPTNSEPASAGEDPASGIDPTLLDAPEPEPVAPVVTRPAASPGDGLSPEERAEAMEEAYAARYRPANNPMQINVAGRLMFANIGGRDRLNGRMGGASVDVGPAWNRIGVAGTLTGFAGRVLLPPETGAELNALLGGGLTLGLGRLALMSHGFADLRIGYDVFYGAVDQRSDAPTVLAPQAEDPRFVAELTQNLVPHGPRVRLDLGLAGAGNRRYFHGFGISIGYQALVGSFKGDMPMANMLTMGLSYWMG
ncbi:hypothetical protein [Paraliomyxa miuraensis]|uniref:hypothetical protein n=1 Tax=Paraliomyxa miuraensis TaxID=376150 RepID=UPI0022572E7A|nr:hypothetical protein [Paraliomyxa miuraensis]MCX4244744.1 hypothetical protein [Paraliomyxa miuraensis]